MQGLGTLLVGAFLGLANKKPCQIVYYLQVILSPVGAARGQGPPLLVDCCLGLPLPGMHSGSTCWVKGQSVGLGHEHLFMVCRVSIQL